MNDVCHACQGPVEVMTGWVVLELETQVMRVWCDGCYQQRLVEVGQLEAMWTSS